jgi:hypothetical protein
MKGYKKGSSALVGILKTKRMKIVDYFRKLCCLYNGAECFV